MSGCHPVFKTTEQALMEMIERLCAVESKLKEDWERIYKRDEAFGKRILELEQHMTKVLLRLAELEHTDHDERIHDLENVEPEARLHKLEKINQDIVETLKDLGNFDVRWKKYLHKFERKTCQYCHGTGKIVEEDLSPNAQGEGERYRMTVCPVCRGQRYT